MDSFGFHSNIFIHESVECYYLLIIIVWQISHNQNYGPIMLGSDSAQKQNVVLPNSFIVLAFLFYRGELKAQREDISFTMSHGKTVAESGI